MAARVKRQLAISNWQLAKAFSSSGMPLSCENGEKG
jgi:hypothetical protein